MAIDYTKRAAPAAIGKITLTKARPAVSLAKRDISTGLLRVNLNWNSRPAKPRGGLFGMRSAAIDLDLGCLYEFTDGSKGVVQALGNAFAATPAGLDESRDGARICGIAMLEQTTTGLSVRRAVNYLDGGQSRLDQAYGWGLRWSSGHK